MSEAEPAINVKIGSQEFQLRRDNSELFTYMAQLAMFNHVFVEDKEENGVHHGTFIPQQLIGDEAFGTIAAAMVQHEYAARINQRAVTDGDADVITKILAGKDVENINDEIPDWLPEV